MTVKAIKKAFHELEAAEKAALLKELITNLAETLAAEDSRDRQVMAIRRGEEPFSRPWKQVRTELLRGLSRTRRRKR